MDLLFVCKDASSSSLVANLLWGIEARKAGAETAVLFSSEALSALHDGAFTWPRELAHQDARWKVADRAKAAGLPIMLRGQARQLDWLGVFAMAKETGLPMYADPIWTDLLGLRGQLPPGIAELSAEAGIELLREAKRVVGSL